jgi:bud emergence protein 1
MAIATGPTGGSNTPPFIKIKVLDRTTDDMIAIRVPPRVTYAQLLDKIRDRLGNAVKVLQFRRQGGGYGDLLDDEGLYEWLRVEEKLVLYAE